MIGKIFSGAPHSVTGTLSAKPSGMENNALTSDFGSLLRMPGQLHQIRSGEDEIETARFDLENFLGIDPASAQSRDMSIGLSFINQSIGKAIRENDVSRTGDALPGLGTEENAELKAAGSPGKPGHLLPGSEPNVLAHGKMAGQMLPAIEPSSVIRGNAVSTGDRSQIDPMAITGIDKVVAGRVPDGESQTDKSAVLVGRGEPGRQDMGNAKGVVQPSDLRGSDADAEISQNGDRHPLKQQPQQHNLRGETAEQPLPVARTPATALLDAQSAPLGAQTMKAVSNELAGVASQIASKISAPKDRRSELDQLGLRTVHREPAPAIMNGLRSDATDNTRVVEPIELDGAPKLKTSESPLVQPMPVHSPEPTMVREPGQKLATFDMSTPLVAQRLAAEIVEISANGETRKFEMNPRNLGRMEIVFTTRGSVEFIEIQTERPAAKEAIMQHSQLLQDLLKSQGRDDLTVRVEVKETMLSGSRSDGTNLSQQEHRGTRDEQPRPSQRRASEMLGGTVEDHPASDNNRYA